MNSNNPPAHIDDVKRNNTDMFRDEDDENHLPDEVDIRDFSFSESHDVAMMLLPSEDEIPVAATLVRKQTPQQRQQTMRRDHLRNLLRKKRVMRRYLKSTLTSMNSFADSDNGDVPTPFLRAKSSGWTAMSRNTTDTDDIFSTEELEEEKQRQNKMKKQRESFVKRYHMDTVEFPIEVRIDSLTYEVAVDPASAKIPTVYNSSNVYRVYKFFQRMWSGTPKPVATKKTVLNDFSLVLKPGKMYLILGPPGSGKSSLLRAIAGRLPHSIGEKVEGSVSYNGKTMKDETEFHIENAVAYIDQLDRHAPRLTVDETFEFAYQMKTGGEQHWMSADEAKEFLKTKDAERFHVSLVLEALGLEEVKDTFVGDENVRGVSGGQRRRVTVGEMLMDRTPILCADEISTGLDAASTYEMIELLNHFGRIQKMSRVIALLQPSPETVSLFDEVIVIAEGELLYVGPIDDVGDYFQCLGYSPPAHLDVADFLQLLTTPDAVSLFEAPPEVRAFRSHPYTAAELAELFRESRYSKRIREALERPLDYVWKSEEGSTHGKVTYLSQWHAVQNRYANSFPRAAWLNFQRHLTIWKRDTRVLIANAAKNGIMGISVGGVFFQTTDEISILGVLFQGMLFIMLGAMTVAPALVKDRIIFRKHADANFFSAYPFVVGRTLAQMPQMAGDICVFGTILYWMVGLNPTTESFFIFLSILFTFSVCMGQLLAVVAAMASTQATVQVVSACLLLFFILFGGFIVPPNVVPTYYLWIYWSNPFSWAYRALLVNEFHSASYEDGDTILAKVGFLYGKDKDRPFEEEWVLYWFLFMIPLWLFSVVLTALALTYKKNGQNSNATRGGMEPQATKNEDQSGNLGGEHRGRVEIPFKPVTITFEDICYDVKASTGNEQLRLLHNVSGIFRGGRMCALMGASGAGKTTLMDVIALRKTNGTISGEVRLNGFLQEQIAFRRTSGYVEQFDVQSPQLTVRETLAFSARLRLDSSQVESDEKRVLFVDQVIQMLELKDFADSLVGCDDEGLSFEQRKRVSIAVEMCASPSALFLDEPTSGLDSRSALLVVKLLRRISDEGRTICCTIHQPSSAVFEMFDDLLLLKRGGEVVFFGELGQNSQNLVRYFEARGSHAIDLGENPANWVLSVISSQDAERLAESYTDSELFRALKDEISAWKNEPDPGTRISFSSEFACPAKTRQNLANRRLATIYWRSPAYNLSRMAVSLVISFVLGSVFIPGRGAETFSESQMRGRLAVIFLSFIIVGILAILSVLPVMLQVRDMYYRHRAAGVMDSTSLAWALGNSEKWFIVLSSFIFCVVFLGTSGLDIDHVSEAIAFWGFFTFNAAIYSYFGQAFVCFVKPMTTAQILSSVFIGLNNFFSGLIVRPQFLNGFFNVPFWITPGHYVYEGMVVSLFTADNRTVFAERDSDFYVDLGCEVDDVDICSGTVSQFVYSFFGGRYTSDHILQNALILGCYLVLARVLTFLALTYINFSAT